RGSWRTSPSLAPRKAFQPAGSSVRRSVPRSDIRLARTLPGDGTNPMTARAVMVLPEPDSPTSATRSAPTAKEMPFTASKTPVCVAKPTARSATSRIGSAMARVEKVTESLREQIEGEAGDKDRYAGAGGDPPLVEDDRRAVSDHGAPLGGRRAH